MQHDSYRETAIYQTLAYKA